MNKMDVSKESKFVDINNNHVPKGHNQHYNHMNVNAITNKYICYNTIYTILHYNQLKI